MNRKMFTITLMALFALLLSVGGVTSQGPAPGEETQPQGEVSIAATVNSRISFQGRLMEDGTPVTDDRDMTFRLYSDETCSTQVGSDIVRPGVPVEDGLFSVKLDVDQSHFNGQGLWLEVLVGGTTVVSCEEMLPVPYALSLRPGAKIDDTASTLYLNRYRSVPPRFLTHKYGIDAEVDGSHDYAYGLYGIANNAKPSGVAYGLYGSATADKGTAIGVYGTAPYTGVEGHATATSGETSGVYGQTDSLHSDAAGVYGQGGWYGVRGIGAAYGVYGEASVGGTAGVYGYHSTSGYGVRAESDSGTGVYAHSDSGVGVHAVSNSDTAVWAQTTSGIAAVDARNTTGTGVSAHSDSGVGVHSISISNTAVYASSDSGVGVHAISDSDTAVWAVTSGGFAGVDARNTNTGAGHGVYAASAGPGLGGAALHAIANAADGIALWGFSDSTDATLVVKNDGTGDLIRAFSSDWNMRFRVKNDGYTAVRVLEITGGADLSEHFDVAATGGEVTPGLVVCIDADHPGRLLVCGRAYDRTVAGVVSGAGGIEPGMVMGQEGSPADGAYPVALTGRVYVWADASAGSIRPGDLLTSSDTLGHVMKVSDYAQAQGAIIGKAMSALAEGRGLILVLVSLQ